jgi:UDP-N-acetylmuramoyl-tripeptide--D-alanyl-D-alanine ligase
MPPEEIWKKLPAVTSSAWGRNQWIKMPKGTKVLFDAYNANPASMAALLKNVYELESEGRKILILGEMLELGKESVPAHKELGELVGKMGADVCWFIGAHFQDVEQGLKSSGFFGTTYCTPGFDKKISTEIKESLAPADLVAVKASRGTKLETVLEDWGIET